MNREMILRVADAIEAAAKPDATPTLGFNMADWIADDLHDKTGHNCGTTACIAGWAIAVNGRDLTEYRGVVQDDAQAILGLNNETAEALFTGYPFFASPTPEEATEVLRHLAETGNVDWSLTARDQTPMSAFLRFPQPTPGFFLILFLAAAAVLTGKLATILGVVP